MTCFITEMPFPWVVDLLKEAGIDLIILDIINNYIPVGFKDIEKIRRICKNNNNFIV